MLAEGIDISDRQDLRTFLVERRLQDTGLQGIQFATKLLARAHHDVGVLQMMLGDHESAYKSLQSAVRLHDGP